MTFEGCIRDALCQNVLAYKEKTPFLSHNFPECRKTCNSVTSLIDEDNRVVLCLTHVICFSSSCLRHT